MFLPTDYDQDNLRSMMSYIEESQLSNILAPIQVDASSQGPWPIETPEFYQQTSFLAERNTRAIVCINLLHISPWEVTVGFFRAAGRLLIPGSGLLFLYGPFKVNGSFTTPSNEDFDQKLKLRNPVYGLRDIEAVEAEAKSNGLHLFERIDMPANNFTLVFGKLHQDQSNQHPAQLMLK